MQRVRYLGPMAAEQPPPPKGLW